MSYAELTPEASKVPALITGTLDEKPCFSENDLSFTLVRSPFRRFRMKPVRGAREKVHLFRMEEVLVSSEDELQLFGEDDFEAPENPDYPEAAEGTGEEEPKKKHTQGRSRYFVWTLNVGKEQPRIDDLIAGYRRNIRRLLDSGDFSFVSVGHEIAPTTGEHHLQGYNEMREAPPLKWTYEKWRKEMTKGFSAGLLKYTKQQDPSRSVGLSIWVRDAMGSAEQNIKYTGKAKEEGRWYLNEGKFRNFGKGKSKAMAAAKKFLDSGGTVKQLAGVEFDLVMRHLKNLQWYYNECVIKKPREQPRGLYIHGPSGVGKTHYVLEHFPESDLVFWFNCVPKNGNVWWEGYAGQKTIVFNDFNCGSFGLGVEGFEYAKQIFDAAPFRVAVHGGLIPLLAHEFIFTANRPPEAIWDPLYTKEPWDDRNPVRRRFDQFFEVRLVGTDDPNYWVRAPQLAVGDDLFPPRPDPPLPQAANSNKRQRRRKPFN